MRTVEAREERLRRAMRRGMGGDSVLPFPVSLEPPFTFFHHPELKPSKGSPAQLPLFTQVKVSSLSALSFLEVKLSTKDNYAPEAQEQLLLALGSRYPVALEVIGLGGKVAIQFVAVKQEAPNVVGQLQAHYPGSQVSEGTDLVSGHRELFSEARGYRLRDSHLFQLRSEYRPESYTALGGILSSLRRDEAGLFQVLFQPARHPWQENIVRVASDPWDASRSSFVDLPDLPRKARSKVERPLFAVAVRLAASSPGVLNRLELGFLSQFQGVENGLVALGAHYPLPAVLGRFAQAPGMLLNARELAALAHLPKLNLLILDLCGDAGYVEKRSTTRALALQCSRTSPHNCCVTVSATSLRGARCPVKNPWCAAAPASPGRLVQVPGV